MPGRDDTMRHGRVNVTFDEQTIYEILSQALLAARLSPGAKLGEHQLAALFGVSRERIRKVLHRLGHERLIDVVPNRGAFVGNPGLEQARAVYEARRVIESGIVARLADRVTAEQLERLRAHVSREFDAARSDKRPLSIRLSMVFHMMLAEMTENEFVTRQLQELVSRTAMLVAYFEPETASSCGCEEHHTIVEALMRRDLPGAARAMSTHLSLIETRLRPMRCEVVEMGIDSVLAQEIKRFDSERALQPGNAARRGSRSKRSRPVARAE
jgi:DNA-binding GntR family transcriptional regulator